MKKILIIGQAPPVKEQKIPYDSTMLYEWLAEIGISQEKAQDLFEFEAMTDKIPKVVKGKQLPPSKFEMKRHYSMRLFRKILEAKVVILLGNCPIKFFGMGGFFKISNEEAGRVYYTLFHPSKRNRKLYNENKEMVLYILREAYNRAFVYQKN